MDFIEQLNWKTGENNLEFFMHEILGYDVEPFHREWLYNLTNYHRTCTICAREHGKSIAVSLVYPLWHMLFSPQINPLDKIDNYDSILISNSLDQSTELIQRIKNEIETNDYLSSVNFKSTNKSRVQMNEKGNNNRINSFAFGSSVRGWHPRMIIIDDPLSDRGTYSDQYIHDFYFSTLTPLIKHDGYAHVVGTPFSYNDLYYELAKPERNYKVTKYPAIVDGHALWPNRWPLDKLEERRREQGDYLFAREYLCNPIDDSSSIFPSDLVKGCIDTRIGFETEPDPTARYVAGVDFSIGTKTSSDYSVITVLKDKGGKLSIVYIWRKNQVDYEEQIEAVMSVYRRFNPTQILVEDNIFQAIFKQMLAKKYIPVKGYTTSRQKKENDIFKLHSLMENKILVLPKGDEESRELVSRLELEALSFGYKEGRLEARIGNDDMIMSLAIAVHAATEFPTVINDGSMFVSGKTENILNIDRNFNMNNFAAPYSNIAAELGI